MNKGESYMYRSTELSKMEEELYRNPARTIYGHVTAPLSFFVSSLILLPAFSLRSPFELHRDSRSRGLGKCYRNQFAAAVGII
jgi:hypothetical protein